MARKRLLEEVDRKQIGERLRIVRGSLTQEAFARTLGCSPTYIADVERGRTKPSLELLRAISEKYAISVDWILAGRVTDEQSVGQWQKTFPSRPPRSEDEKGFWGMLMALWRMYTATDQETRAWLRVQLKRAVPEIEESAAEQHAKEQKAATREIA